jgi:DNA segregation ATPase FtsK/SpoIIIE, S-DNA-T family
MTAAVIAGGAALGVFVWVLAKIGYVLIKVAEALAAATAVVLAVWWVIKAVVRALRQALMHWRASLIVVGVLAWWDWWGWVWFTGGGEVREAHLLATEATSYCRYE